MKIAAALATFTLAAVASAQGPVDPAKLGNGWCVLYSGSSCEDEIVPTFCGANATFATTCKSTFSQDKICMSFEASCTCTPLNGTKALDLSTEAFNKTFEIMSYGMCNNLLFSNKTDGPGIVSGDYKPDGKRPTAGVATPKPAAPTTPATEPVADNNKSAASAIQMAASTVTLAAISLGLAMI
ncbi:hypothetical protein BGZ94_002533 [Podila epigama]|nr:hypothetical protein BGZ94_002533 [Podila epigama]